MYVRVCRATHILKGLPWRRENRLLDMLEFRCDVPDCADIILDVRPRWQERIQGVCGVRLCFHREGGSVNSDQRSVSRKQHQAAGQGTHVASVVSAPGRDRTENMPQPQWSSNKSGGRGNLDIYYSQFRHAQRGHVVTHAFVGPCSFASAENRTDVWLWRLLLGGGRYEWLEPTDTLVPRLEPTDTLLPRPRLLSPRQYPTGPTSSPTALPSLSRSPTLLTVLPIDALLSRVVRASLLSCASRAEP